MRSNRKANRQAKGRQAAQAKRPTRRAGSKAGARKGKTTRSEEGSAHPSKEERREKDARLAKDFGKFLEASGQKRIKIKDIDPSKDKRIAKEIRATLNTPRTPRAPTSPYVALLQPFVIVADNAEDKSVIADAGTVVQLMDQGALYRDRISPITRRADERLVRFGKPDKPILGWLPVQALAPKAMKQVKGPTYLVQTKREEDASAWDLFRLKIGRARKGDPSEWLVPWLVRNGAKHPVELRNVVRLFGGKPIKNESFDVRCVKAFQLILRQEIDMATAKEAAKAKKKGAKKGAKAKPEKAEKATAKKTAGKKAKSAKVAKKTAKPARGDSDRITKSHDEHVIRRLVKENPRRAGSDKAKIWDKLRKGMTVGEFLTKGGTRGAVGRYIKNGWIKLLRPKGDAAETE